GRRPAASEQHSSFQGAAATRIIPHTSFSITRCSGLITSAGRRCHFDHRLLSLSYQFPIVFGVKPGVCPDPCLLRCGLKPMKSAVSTALRWTIRIASSSFLPSITRIATAVTQRCSSRRVLSFFRADRLFEQVALVPVSADFYRILSSLL